MEAVLGRRKTKARRAAAAALLLGAWLAPVDGQEVPPPTRLHLFPTTSFPAPWQASIDFGQTSTFGGGTSDGGSGTGNQTYHGWIEIGLPGRVALLGILEHNDDLTWGRLAGERYEKEIFAIGGGVRWLAGTWRDVRVAAEGTLASLQLKSDPGLFNPPPGMRRTHHLSASATVSAGIPLSRSWTLTLSPGLIVLPGSVSGLPFFGWTGSMGAGIDGQVAARFRAFAAGEFLLGPGTNGVDGEFHYRRIPVGSAGLVFQPSPRVQVMGYLTNAAGGTAGTRLLSQLGEVPLQWGARVRYAPTALERDRTARRMPAKGGGPATASSPPQGRAEAGRASSTPPGDGATEAGLSVPPAATLPTWTFELRATQDRSRSVRLRAGLSREFEVELGVARVPGLDGQPTLGIHLGDRIHFRMGGMLQLAAETWGDPVTVGARVAVGRDGGTYQGYLVAELPVRRRVNPWAAVTVAPALLQTGGESPTVLRVAGVLGCQGRVQLVVEPTLHLSGGHGAARRSGLTTALRSPAWRGVRGEAYVTTVQGLLGAGRFLAEPDGFRGGVALTLKIR